MAPSRTSWKSSVVGGSKKINTSSYMGKNSIGTTRNTLYSNCENLLLRTFDCDIVNVLMGYSQFVLCNEYDKIIQTKQVGLY